MKDFLEYPNDQNSNLEGIMLEPNIKSSDYLNITDEQISKIEEDDFNIFELEKQVGEKNILSIISSYIYTSMGFFSFLNYENFDNFVMEISKGYFRENPYHNVFIFLF